ncbi:nuclear transport factor 2 family protein [Caballeronia sp. dw_19]|uniref:nuclear transport factor 2 family protein n=1 Tax=Caballeronia sp. dw_19 TaxID=2719791 RepID=UPI001BD2320B
MNDTALTDIERLMIERACCTLVQHAADAVDAANADELTRLFTGDAQLWRPGGGLLTGREAILASYRARTADRITRHLIAGTSVEVVGAERARGLSRVLVWSSSTSEAPGPFGRRATRQVLGAFEDEFVKHGAVWLIAKRHASFELYTE